MQRVLVVQSAVTFMCSQTCGALTMDNRRQWLGGLGASITLNTRALPSGAFENALPEASKYAERSKRRGPLPTDLGVSKRDAKYYGIEDEEMLPGLKPCSGAPNCFTTTGDPELDGGSMIAPWQPPAGSSPTEAMADINVVVKSYEVIRPILHFYLRHQCYHADSEALG